VALADETTRLRRAGTSQGHRNGGYLATIRSTPDAEGAEIKVVLPSLSGEHQWSTRRWHAHPNGHLPLSGDIGLAVIDERGGIWLLDWYASEDA
jgi:hypothetical protein